MVVALSITEKRPTRLPIAVGLNATLTVHEEPAGNDEPHAFAVMLKSPGSVPVKPMLVNETVPEPPAVSVNVCALVSEPTSSDPNTSEDGFMVSVVVLAAIPVPLRATVCGLLLAVSVKVNVAVRTPMAVGVKIRSTEQAVCRLEVRQALILMAKSAGSAPDRLTLEIEIGEPALFVSVTDSIPLAEPTATLPKFRLVGFTLADPLTALPPVPESGTLSAVELLLTVMLQVAENDPMVAGLNVIEAAQLAAAVRVGPQELEVILKSPAFVPDIAPAPSVTESDVPFVIVIDCVLLAVPLVTVPNDKLIGDTLTWPIETLESVPVPDSEISWELVEPLLVMTSVADRVAVAMGLKITVMLHVADGARVVPQVFWEIE